jgi:hypothetical protein
MSNDNCNNFLISLRHDDKGDGVPGYNFEKSAVYISSTTVLVKPEKDPPTYTYNLKKDSQSKDDWIKAIKAIPTDDHQQVLVFVHGFGNDAAAVVSRHKSVKLNVPDGFALVSFDWPSGNPGPSDSTGVEKIKGAYAEDKCNAEKSALMLMSDCLVLLATEFGPKNVHLFGHSMGAYVVERAFHCPPVCFQPINHVLLAAADVDQSNYAAGSKPLVKFLSCCNDLSVYWSKDDDAMILSALVINKTPRLGGGGRGGFPLSGKTPPRCTSIDCTRYWAHIVKPTLPNETKKEKSELLESSHVWYIVVQSETNKPGNDFYGDMVSVLKSASTFPTRAKEICGDVFRLSQASNENTICTIL